MCRAGLGQCMERNGWPIARMRRRFKCAKGEQATDTERISGHEDEEPSMGGCSVLWPRTSRAPQGGDRLPTLQVLVTLTLGRPAGWRRHGPVKGCARGVRTCWKEHFAMAWVRLPSREHNVGGTLGSGLGRFLVCVRCLA